MSAVRLSAVPQGLAGLPKEAGPPGVFRHNKTLARHPRLAARKGRCLWQRPFLFAVGQQGALAPPGTIKGHFNPHFGATSRTRSPEDSSVEFALDEGPHDLQA